MGRRCAIPYCKSGHRGYEHQKITIFSIPKNNIEAWSKILGCVLNEKSCVCEKHFNKNDIKSEKIIAADGKIIFKHLFSKKSLAKGAMPILNYDEPPMKLAKIDTSSIIQQSQGESTEQLQSISKLPSLPINFTVLKNTNSQSDINEVTIVTEKDMLVTSGSELHSITSNEVVTPTINRWNTIDKNESEPKSLFKQICANTIYIKQPGLKWNFHKSLEPPILVFSELNLVSTPTHGENKAPVYTKKVLLDDQLHVQLFIGQKKISLEFINDPKSQEDLENLLVEVDTLIVCTGGPKVTMFKKIHPQCAYKDENKWRHNCCPIIIMKGNVCQYCVSLHKTFAQHIDRQRRSFQKRLILSPKTKNRVQSLYKRTRDQARKLTRKEKQIQQVTEYMEELHQKMDEIETERVRRKKLKN